MYALVLSPETLATFIPAKVTYIKVRDKSEGSYYREPERGSNYNSMRWVLGLIFLQQFNLLNILSLSFTPFREQERSLTVYAQDL